MTTFSPLSGSPTSVKNELSSPVNNTTVSTATKTTTTQGAAKPKSRKRVNTAEKRHQHNAIERQRRETLNGKFLSLARLLPSLASHRRPSKSAIVNGSITHLTHQRNQRLLASKLLRQLCAERDELFNEVNQWRKAGGFAPKEGTTAWTKEMDEIAKVENETFGNFASVGGDNGDGEDEDKENDNEDEDQAMEMNLERASMVAASLGVNGLITPRSSTDIDSSSHVKALYANVAQPQQSNNWSSDFVFGVHNLPQTNVPFNNFMNDNQSSSASPHSFHGSVNGTQNTILTPPATADLGYGITHTPSPRSSNSADEVKVVPSQAQPWTNQHLLLVQQAQQQQQQQQLQQRQQLQAMKSHSFSGASSFMPGYQNNNYLPNANQGGATDAFTQSLMASMFPQRDLSSISGNDMFIQGMGLSNEQIAQWRTQALGGLMSQQRQGPAMSVPPNEQPSMDDLKNAVRHGMGLGLGMSTMWNEQQQHHQVEGF